ncbi:hypothetical protein ELI_4309 [Eubacterium callanderi]|uniref:Uncharacterized protein n=1 Tax=Eubacterium callanderi TaxID=53442 RepID=E3GQF7_9FIRM|nr:hypothetical protein ELI_4309 [Eubacterium callanderi]
MLAFLRRRIFLAVYGGCLPCTAFLFGLSQDSGEAGLFRCLLIHGNGI